MKKPSVIVLVLTLFLLLLLLSVTRFMLILPVPSTNLVIGLIMVVLTLVLLLLVKLAVSLLNGLSKNYKSVALRMSLVQLLKVVINARIVPPVIVETRLFGCVSSLCVLQYISKIVNNASAEPRRALRLVHYRRPASAPAAHATHTRAFNACVCAKSRAAARPHWYVFAERSVGARTNACVLLFSLRAR